jgi:hypothetical protein
MNDERFKDGQIRVELCPLSVDERRGKTPRLISHLGVTQ